MVERLPSNLAAGSIIVVVATDAPLLAHQLKRIARRVGMGLGKLGSWAGNGSGDLFLAFSTANAGAAEAKGLAKMEMLRTMTSMGCFERRLMPPRKR